MRLACDLFVGLLESKGMTQPPVDTWSFWEGGWQTRMSEV